MGNLQTIMDDLKIDKNDLKCIGLLCIIIFIIYTIYSQNYKTNKIPKVIYQTYKNKDVPPLVKERWLEMNPDYEYHLYDDDDCYQFLLDYYDKEHADFFKYQIKDGPIKSDFWRVCMLYKFGGVYADIDIVPHVPIREFVDPNTTLYTCIDYKNTSLNPHFIAVTPKNELMKECIDIYMNYIRHHQYNYWNYSITRIMKEVISNFLNIYNLKEGIYKLNGEFIQLSQEICPYNGQDLFLCFIKQSNKKIMSNRDSNLYNPYSHSFN